ncbi:hypothetical protein [Agathobacter sp.]
MRKKKFVATAVALAMAAVTVFSVGGSPAYANENVDIAIQTETASESVVLPVSVASEAWIYSDGSREFGTWKALNIKVNDTMYPLSKDVAVNVTFSNGDEIKIYSGDSYELWEGIISISGDEINVTSQNNKYTYDGHTGTTRWGCNLVYSDGSLILTKTQNHNGGGGVASTPQKIFYDYDLTAKTDAGVPIEGVSVVDEGSYGRSNNWLDMICFGYIQENNTWGNGNSFDLEEAEGGRYFINSKRVTNKNGVIDMYLPEELKHSDTGFDADIYIGGDIYAELSEVGKKRVFVNNGLVDVTINDEYYASVTSFGLNATFNTIDTDEILGDYYYYSDELTDITSNNSVTLKDTFGNDIAVVTMGVKETEKQHLIGKENGNYKATGLKPVVDVKMADGVTDWTVSVTTDDDTFHINAVRKASESNTGDGTTSDGSTTDKYITDLSKAESQVVSLDTFASILAENATKDVIIKSNNNVTFTFAKGTMASVDGKTEYDFSTSIVNAYADTMPSYITKDNFVSQINYNYSGKLPATANIRFYAGKEYAGQTLYYSLMNADNTFAEVQAVVVDADGYMTVKQDHCSSYVVTKTEPKLPSNNDTKTDDGNASASDNNTSSGNTTVSTDKNASSTNASVTSPKTGDMTPIAIYVVMAVAAVGVIVFVKRRKTA